MKKFTLTLFTVLCAVSMNAQIVINEIMYNGPESGTDTTEFIEFYNTTNADVDLTGWSFSQGVVHTFTSGTVSANGYFVIAMDSAAFHNTFGVAPNASWTSGGLSNGGEDITILDNNGLTIDSVFYDDNAPWPAGTTAGQPDGGGSSIELCDATLDNNNGANWYASTGSTGVMINGNEILATPGAANTAVCSSTPTVRPTYLISEIDGVNSLGVADSLGVVCQIYGVVHCQDFKGGNGLEFTVMESPSTNIGIKVFSFSDVDAYTVTEGDSLRIVGAVAQYRGQLQFAPDSIEVISQGHPTVTPLVVTTFSETEENKLVQLDSLTIVDTTQWTGSGSGFNVDVTNGADTVVMRIDNDSPLYTQAVPTASFTVVGLVGQYDSSSPYTEGYSVYPCSLTEISDSTSTGDSTNTVVELNGIDFNIYPNPTENILNVVIESTDAFDVQVINLAGQVILTEKVKGTATIDVSELTAGFYTINFVGNNGTATTRLIKQ